MKKYKIQDREAGNVIEENLTFEQAQEMVLAFVKADKKEGNYTPEFYEIKEMETNEEDFEMAARRYATIKGKGEFGLVFSAFKQGANWQKEQTEKENEELKARCETYKKDYDSMVAEVVKLSGEKSELLEALSNLIKVSEESTKDIVAFENADILDNCIDKAKAVITK